MDFSGNSGHLAFIGLGFGRKAPSESGARAYDRGLRHDYFSVARLQSPKNFLKP